jgi:hypothetical protein
VVRSSQDNTIDAVMQNREEGVVRSNQDNTIDDVMQREYKKAALPKGASAPWRLQLSRRNKVMRTKVIGID